MKTRYLGMSRTRVLVFDPPFSVQFYKDESSDLQLNYAVIRDVNGQRFDCMFQTTNEDYKGFTRRITEHVDEINTFYQSPIPGTPEARK